MHEESEFRSHARPGNHALISGCGQRRAALRDEDVWGRWGFAQERPVQKVSSARGEIALLKPTNRRNGEYDLAHRVNGG
jgi:hypothetical protein